MPHSMHDASRLSSKLVQRGRKSRILTGIVVVPILRAILNGMWHTNFRLRESLGIVVMIHTGWLSPALLIENASGKYANTPKGNDRGRRPDSADRTGRNAGPERGWSIGTTDSPAASGTRRSAPRRADTGRTVRRQQDRHPGRSSHGRLQGIVGGAGRQRHDRAQAFVGVRGRVGCPAGVDEWADHA